MGNVFIEPDSARTGLCAVLIHRAMTNLRFGRHGFAAAMALGAVGVLASCDSGSGGGDDSAAVAGQTSAAGSPAAAAGSPSAVAGAGASVGGAQTGGAGAPGSSGASGSIDASGGTAGGAGQGQAGSPSVAGGGTGGKGTAGSPSMGGSSSAAGSAGMPGGAGAGPLPLPAITGGTQGFASRFWDCCKPSCGGSKLTCNKGNSPDNGSGQSACSGGNSFMCWSFEPFVDPANKYVSYAFAASNVGCGGCYELQFTGKAGCSDPSTCPGSASNLSYNTVYVQVINSGSDVKGNQFDLLIPGGGVGLYNACSNQWGTSDLGSTYGGFLAGCKGSVSCTQTKCNTVFAGKPDLLAGCNWFLTWFGAGDNPQITYKKVTCPKQLTDKSGMGG
jgi:Glycosyl hydrolase family 45